MKYVKQLIVSVVCVLTFGFGAVATAQPNMEQQMPPELQSSIADDFAHCAAYFTVYAEGAEQSGQVAPDKIKKFRHQAVNLLELSAQLTSKDLARSRFSMASKDMFNTMQGSWQNFDLVSDRYHYQCINMLKHPREYMKHKIRQYKRHQQ